MNLDCMDATNGLPSLPDGFFNLAIVDPPYGIGADVAQNKAAQQRINAQGKTKAGRGWKMYQDTNWDSAIPSKEYWDELFRVSKNQVVWGGNYFTEFLPPSMGWIVWDKCQREFSLADGELAWTSFNKALRICSLSRGLAQANNNNTGGRVHPTQKPVKLYQWILDNYANPGDIILDTHVGSGSSLVAFKSAGYNFYGYEIDPTYYKEANKRLQNVQTRLI